MYNCIGKTRLTSSTITGSISSAEMTCFFFSGSTSEVGVNLGTKSRKIYQEINGECSWCNSKSAGL